MKHLHIFGRGYSAGFTAIEALKAGFKVTATTSRPLEQEPYIHCTAFTEAHQAASQATHLLISIPPDDNGDRVLPLYRDVLARSSSLQWVGYYSSTGIYGHQNGAWVDEDTPPTPHVERGMYRLKAEQQWQVFVKEHTHPLRLDIMRLGGIYGPGRNVFERLSQGMPFVVDAPTHFFSHIHTEDIAQATVKAMQHITARSVRILNFVDDAPATQQESVAYAAQLLQIEMPQLFSLEEIWGQLTSMQKSFWSANRRVGNEKTHNQLALQWRYPTLKVGLLALWHQYYKL